MNYQEPIPPATNLRTHHTSPECKNIHQSWCQMGIQQHTHQRGRQVWSSIYHKPRAVWTYCNVLQANKLPSNLSNNDECNLCPRNSWRMANCLYGWYTHHHLKFHEECVHCVLEKLCLHNLYLKPEKCTFEQQWMEFLGVILKNGTVQMDPAKLKGIADWPQPQCITDVHAFLGFTGFYHYFMLNYSNIAQPLIQLTKKNAVFRWTEECKVAFEQLKMLMCSHPILWQPDYTKAFFLTTDALAYSMGAILSQEGEINPCTQKPMLCPIAYYLATFTPTQHNYNIYEQEFLGVYMPLMKYRPHLAATEIPVTILMDHTNLLHWKSPQKVNWRVARWFSDLQDYNLIFKHIPSKIHTAPNMLSQPPRVNKGKHNRGSDSHPRKTLCQNNNCDSQHDPKPSTCGTRNSTNRTGRMVWHTGS